jgi:tRNA threonylcarbamoyladenosine biosynthesis protein TsaB
VGVALVGARAGHGPVAGTVLILGIETATPQVSVAIGGHEGVLALLEISRGRRHAETLVPAIDFLCAQADFGLEDVAVIAVDVGPGLFTGMRVGLATAKALALALRVPMIGISSLDLLAFPHRRADRTVVPVVDARKGEVFYAMYRPVPGGVQQVLAPRVASVDELVADLLARSHEALLVGDGAMRYRDEIRVDVRCELADQAYPSAGPLVQLAHARALREEWSQPSEIQPLYLRPPDADINWATRATMASRPFTGEAGA